MTQVVEVFLSFVRLGLLSFGSVNLAAMGQVVVEGQHWLTQERFVQGYALGHTVLLRFQGIREQHPNPLLGQNSAAGDACPLPPPQHRTF